MHKLLKMYLPRSKSMENKKTKFLSDDDKSFFLLAKERKQTTFIKKKKLYIYLCLSFILLLLVTQKKLAMYMHCLINQLKFKSLLRLCLNLILK